MVRRTCIAAWGMYGVVLAPLHAPAIEHGVGGDGIMGHAQILNPGVLVIFDMFRLIN